ncbi:MAG: TetR/AcrR family transcriptional regulator [Mycobacteriales bacterium]
MSTAYETTGRVQQKRRTRDALVAAARELVAQGVAPTVEQAAATAGVSRTTAYRYFTTQRALLGAAHPFTAQASLLPENSSDDPRERLDLVLRTLISSNIELEAQQRTMLRLSLEASPEERAALPLRQGRAIGWIEEALAPLRERMSAKEVRQLVLAIRATTGIESLVWLTDVAGLSRKQAAELMLNSGRALLEHALATKTK